MQVIVPGSGRRYLDGDSLDHSAPLVFTIANVFAASECADAIGKIEQLGFEAAPITTPRGFVMRPDIRNNTRVMFDDTDLAAQLFAPHYDGAYRRSATERSELTLMVYLNNDFTGGKTAFHDFNASATPRTGTALLFQHRLLHEGCVVTSGIKYVLRSDVMYAD